MNRPCVTSELRTLGTAFIWIILLIPPTYSVLRFGLGETNNPAEREAWNQIRRRYIKIDWNEVDWEEIEWHQIDWKPNDCAEPENPDCGDWTRWKKQDWENFEIWTAENWDAIDWEEEFFEKLSLENWQAFLNYIDELKKWKKVSRRIRKFPWESIRWKEVKWHRIQWVNDCRTGRDRHCRDLKAMKKHDWDQFLEEARRHHWSNEDWEYKFFRKLSIENWDAFLRYFKL